eukprot:scpid71098/ scgid26798/ 
MASLANFFLFGLLVFRFARVVLSGSAQSVDASHDVAWMPSCMSQTMVAAGISPEAGAVYERYFAMEGFSVQQILKASDLELARAIGYVLPPRKSMLKLRNCLQRATPQCYAVQCQNGGVCAPIQVTNPHYYCQCSGNYGGHYCEQDKATTDFGNALHVMREEVSAQTKKLSTMSIAAEKNDVTLKSLTFRQNQADREWPDKVEREAKKLNLCSRQYLGYEYQVSYNAPAVSQNKPIAQMIFAKLQSSTALRISYTASVRINLPAGNQITRFYFKIDNSECKTPEKLQTYFHHHDNTNGLSILPLRMEGVCEATSQSTLGKGNRTLALYVEDRNGANIGSSIRYRPSTSLFEVQELCKPVTAPTVFFPPFFG